MKVTTVQSPNHVKQVTTNETAQKAKAIEAFNKASQSQPTEIPQQSVVNTAPIPVDPNNISVEELSAVQGQNRTTEETQTTETSTPPESKTPVRNDDQSSAMQLLARKEKQLRQQAQQLQQQTKAKETAWAQEKAALEQRLADLEKNSIPRNRLKERAFDVLEEEGINYDTITQQAIDAQNKNPRYEAFIDKQNERIAKLEQELQRRDTEAKQQTTTQYQAAIKQITTDAKQLVDTDPNFEMIKATGSVRDVVELIEATYKEEGRVMTVEEAAEEVENYLLDESIKLANTKKVKERIGQKPAAAAQSQETQRTPQQQPSKTLTNASSSTRKLSARERALLAFKGELK